MAATEQAPGVGTRVVWRFVDGKPGHENQSRGLIQALADRIALDVHDIRSPGRPAALLDWIRGGFPPGAGLPSPDLLIGAGHGTHLPMLAARRARGGRVVALMKPSLPLGWFDLCLIPAHDRPPRRANVIVTRGVLNAVRRTDAHEPGAGLILVGGPSAHYGWDEAALVRQVAAIVEGEPERSWTLTTSRRTPASTVAALRGFEAANFLLVPWEDTDPGWVPAQLQRAATVWVTEDSVSMLYEALTSGAACGLLPVPQRRASRVSGGVRALEREGMVTRFDAWTQGAALAPPPVPFNEAQRCAELILQRLCA